MVTWKTSVRWSEVDAAGIIYHAHVFDWFSETRIAWLRHHQLDYYDVLRPLGVELLVKDARASFSHALELGDAVEVSGTLSQLSPTRCTFSYRIANPRLVGSYAVNGSTEHAFVVEGRAKRLDRYAPEMFKQLFASVEESQH